MTTPPLTIDCQVHCYERNRPERPWQGHPGGAGGSYRRRYGGGDGLLPYATSCPLLPH